MALLSDADVFGSPRLMSDQEVFGGGQPQADPGIGHPQDLTFAERYIAPVLEKLGIGDIAGGNLRGSAVGGAMQGAADPGAAIAQMVGNAIGQGATVNKAVKNEEDQYQAARKSAGRDGIDLARLGGNTGMTAFMLAASPGAPKVLEDLPAIVKGAGAGATFGALEPVTNGGDNFLADKAKQVGIGAAAGGATSLLGSMLARTISPKASVNPDVQLLRDAGVNPTIGQTLGGMANTVEEKAMSLPIVGDMIASARRGAVKDFNSAVLNTAAAPIGQTAKGAGFDAVGDVGSKLGAAYDKAAAEVGHVNLDTPSFNAKFGQLLDMAQQGLSPDLSAKFQNVVNNEVLRRLSPNGSLVGSDIKTVDSALGKIAANWRGSPNPSDREFGQAVRQLQQVIRDGVAEASPTYDAARQAADQGYRVFKIAQDAAAAAKNREGIFTPAQFNSAVQRSSGKAAMGSGRAFMQDVGQAAQNVLGNKYPDSGSIGRLLLPYSLGTLAHFGTGGATTAALGAGALAYTRPVQNALVALVAKRPDKAPEVANYLRRLAIPAATATVPAIEQRYQ